MRAAPEIRKPSTSGTPLILAICAAVGMVIFHLAYAAMGFPLYRDQHLGTALIYARDGIDLLRPIIVGFNANNAPTALEFPLWQAAAALPLRWFGEWFGWASIVSLIFFFTALYPTQRLGARLGGNTVGWWVVALVLIQPLVWINAGMASTDGTSIAAAIWFFYYGCRALEGSPRLLWTICTALLGALAATLKLPFMMAAGIALGIILLVQHGRELAAWLSLGTAALFAGGVFLLWTRHTDACIAQAEFGYIDLRLSHNPDIVWWYFGDWNFRLNPASWIKGGWRALNGLFGSFALVAVPLAALGLRRGNLIGAALLVGALVGTAVFSHLVLFHQHYFLMYSLPVALLIGPVVAAGWSGLASAWKWPRPVLVASLLLIAFLSVLQGLIGLESIQQDPYPASMVKRLREHTSAGDRLLIIGGGWGGNFLFLSDRRGLTIWDTVFLEKDNNLQRLRALGYNKLVIINESPLTAALQMTNPGGAAYRRITYPDVLTPQSQAWPTVYRDEDLQVRTIPD